MVLQEKFKIFQIEFNEKHSNKTIFFGLIPTLKVPTTWLPCLHNSIQIPSSLQIKFSQKLGNKTTVKTFKKYVLKQSFREMSVTINIKLQKTFYIFHTMALPHTNNSLSEQIENCKAIIIYNF